MESTSSITTPPPPSPPQKQTLIVNARLNVAPGAPLHRLHVSNGRISLIEVDSGDAFDGSEYATVIDADGATVFPGLQDAHIHVAMLGESLHYVNLIDCYSIDAMKDLIEKKLVEEPHLPFVVGFNWDQTKLGRLPSRFDIDSICSKPVFLWRACWHIGVANSSALELTGHLQTKLASDIVLDPATGQHVFRLPGGAVDYDGNTLLPTGILRERACEPMMAALSKYKTREAYVQFVREGLQVCLRKGITCVHTNDEHSLSIYQQLQAQQALPIRVLLTPNQQELEHDESLSPFGLFDMGDDNGGGGGGGSDGAAAGPRDAHGMSSRLGMNRVKIFSDGSLGAETAAMKVLSDATSDTEAQASFKGILMHSEAAMEKMIVDATKRAFRVEIHAIGDAAADQVVSAIDRVNQQRQTTGASPLYRPLLTHCQVLGPDIVRLMHVHDVIANIQPSFVPTDMRWVMNRMSDTRQLQYAYAWKTLLHSQYPVHCAGGSDAPIEDASPWYGIYDAMFRTNQWRLGSESSEATTVFRPEEKLSFEEAVGLYTTGASFAAGYEAWLGQIAVGQVADLVLMKVPSVTSTTEATTWDWLMTQQSSLVIVGGHVSYVHTDATRMIQREDAKSSSLRPHFDVLTPTVSQGDPGETPNKPIDGAAPYIPGKGGYFEPVEPASQVRNSGAIGSRKRDSVGRKGYCRCLLHMEYCM